MVPIKVATLFFSGPDRNPDNLILLFLKILLTVPISFIGGQNLIDHYPLKTDVGNGATLNLIFSLSSNLYKWDTCG